MQVAADRLLEQEVGRRRRGRRLAKLRGHVREAGSPEDGLLVRSLRQRLERGDPFGRPRRADERRPERALRGDDQLHGEPVDGHTGVRAEHGHDLGKAGEPTPGLRGVVCGHGHGEP